MTLKNPTEAEKAFLAIFDEPTPTKSHSTRGKGNAERAEENLRRQNRHAFETRLGYKIPTSEIAEKIAAAQAVVWIPSAYVLFVRQATCKNCGARERVLDVPRLFLEQRKERRDESHPLRYGPVTGIEFPKLPRRKVVNFVTTPFCLDCFEDPQLCANFTSSNQGATLLPIEEKEANEFLQSVESASTEADLQSSQIQESPPNTEPGAPVGCPSEKEFGSVCGEREFAPSVTAEG